MQELFADAWFFIALSDRFDSHHRAAIRVKQRVSQYQLVTHDAILHELLAFASADGAFARQRAVIVAREAIASMRVITPDRSLLLRALDLYASRPDKEYSLTDCMSMVVRECDITQVLSNDHHFRQEGFTLVNE